MIDYKKRCDIDEIKGCNIFKHKLETMKKDLEIPMSEFRKGILDEAGFREQIKSYAQEQYPELDEKDIKDYIDFVYDFFIDTEIYKNSSVIFKDGNYITLHYD